MGQIRQEALASLADPLAQLVRNQLKELKQVNDVHISSLATTVSEAIAREVRDLASQAAAAAVSASPVGRNVPPSPLSRMGNQKPR